MRNTACPASSMLVFSAVLATLLTVLMTTPFPFFISQRLVGLYGSDGFGQMWAMWWFGKAFFDLHQSPARVSCLSYPEGVYQPALTATPYIRLVSLPLVLTRPVVAYNLHLFTSFVLCWVFMVLLCYDLTGSRAPRWSAGRSLLSSPTRPVMPCRGTLT